jgi:hypothetical protein
LQLVYLQHTSPELQADPILILYSTSLHSVTRLAPLHAILLFRLCSQPSLICDLQTCTAGLGTETVTSQTHTATPAGQSLLGNHLTNRVHYWTYRTQPLLPSVRPEHLCHCHNCLFFGRSRHCTSCSVARLTPDKSARTLNWSPHLARSQQTIPPHPGTRNVRTFIKGTFIERLSFAHRYEYSPRRAFATARLQSIDACVGVRTLRCLFAAVQDSFNRRL